MVYYSAGFHMGLCSLFGVDPLQEIAKDDNTLMFTLPHRSDLKKFNLRKKLKRLTVNKIREIQYDYAINNDKIDKFNRKLSSELNDNNEDVLVIGQGNETLIFENLKPNDAIKIDYAVDREFERGNLSVFSCETRFDYLLHNPDKIDKSVSLNDGVVDICPFCEGSFDEKIFCKACGQLSKPLSMESKINEIFNFK